MNDEDFMRVALSLAEISMNNNDLPVGCVIVLNGKIIATGLNGRSKYSSKLAHAEMCALSAAQQKLAENVGKCNLYVTLEPCMMCMGAIISSKIYRVVFGATDHVAGVTAHLNINQHYRQFSPIIIGGVLAADSLSLLRKYVENKGDVWVD